MCPPNSTTYVLHVLENDGSLLVTSHRGRPEVCLGLLHLPVVLVDQSVECVRYDTHSIIRQIRSVLDGLLRYLVVIRCFLGDMPIVKWAYGS